jgi:ubiquinone/menaquinone biosynthesis C-methylase UbiE
MRPGFGEAMSANVGAYHVLELQIASNPADIRRVMPTIKREHERILDVGCGAGQTLIASALGANVTAIGIDDDVEALKLGHRIDPRIQYICSKGEALPLRSGHFDLVISRVALPYMNTRTALSEMTRVLRPGGTMWVVLHPFAKLVRELEHYLRKRDIGAALHRVYVMVNGALFHLAGIEFPSLFSHRYESFQTEIAIQRELERLGYEDIRIHKKAFFVVSATKPKTGADGR